MSSILISGASLCSSIPETALSLSLHLHLHLHRRLRLNQQLVNSLDASRPSMSLVETRKQPKVRGEHSKRWIEVGFWKEKIYLISVVVLIWFWWKFLFSFLLFAHSDSETLIRIRIRMRMRMKTRSRSGMRTRIRMRMMKTRTRTRTKVGLEIGIRIGIRIRIRIRNGMGIEIGIAVQLLESALVSKVANISELDSCGLGRAIVWLELGLLAWDKPKAHLSSPSLEVHSRA